DDVVEAIEVGQLRRAASLDSPVGSGDAPPLGSSLGDVDAAFGDVEGSVTVPPLIAKLSGPERELIRLRFYEGLTQNEIAGQLGTSQMHVSRALRRILSRLRALVES